MAVVTLLLSVDPEQNRFRFFRLELEEHTDRVELHRVWGRIGTEGRREVQRFTSIEAARTELERIVGRRARRGYVEATELDLHRALRTLAHRRAARRAPQQLQFALAAGF